MDASPLREDPAKARSRRSSRETERHLAESPRDSAAHHSPRDSAHHVQDIRAVQAPSSATGALPALSGSLSLHEPAVASPQAPRSATGRLYCLDALRGLTVCLMIFVDNAGEWLGRGVDHSPWDGVTLADFVMPFFLFLVGSSMSLSFGKYSSVALFYKVLGRTARLFLIGIATQGADLWGGGGWNMSSIRIGGILQRIAWAYFVVAMMSIYLPRCTTRLESRRVARFEDVPGPAALKVFRFYAMHWLVALGFLLVYVIIMLFVPVPTWVYEIKRSVGEPQCVDSPPWDLPGVRTCTSTIHPGVNITVACDVSGDLTPKCSAARMVDAWILGWQHMPHDMFAHRLPECSACYPGDCPREDSHRPGWCRVPFEPEGVVSSLPTVTTTWIGMHFGLVLKHHKEQAGLRWVALSWVPQSAFLLVLGTVIHFAGWPMNKQLWSPSFVFFMAGSAGGFLVTVFALVDYTSWQPRPFRRKWRLPALLQKTSPAEPQLDSLDGALRSCTAAEETLAEAQEELRVREVGLATRKKLAVILAQVGAVRSNLKASIRDEARTARLVDVVFAPFSWVGMNTITIYLLAPAAGLFHSLLEWFYWEGDRENNLADWAYRSAFCGAASSADFQSPSAAHPGWAMHDPACTPGVAPAGPATKYHCAECVGGAFDGERERDAQVAWALVRIAFWMAVAGVMHWRGVYLAL